MPNPPLWPREAHTEGKHLVLRAYLDAWLPILGSWNGRVLFIDGFAGPGAYEGGEDGSPIIALKALVEHAAQKVISAEVGFIFIEKEKDRADHLKELVDRMRGSLPDNAKVLIEQGEFEAALSTALDTLDHAEASLAPALVMIDPFGVAGAPMSLIERLLRNPRCEIYASFMYESMNRFLSTPEFETHLDALFGTDAWRGAIELRGAERQAYLYGLYERQLRAAGASHVVRFDLYDGNRLVYAIFFGTQHVKGCDVMKRAIWKVIPGGDFTFRGSKSDQLVLGIESPNFEPLKGQLRAVSSGRSWIAIEEVIDFVSSDRTEYHSGQVKGLFREMERAGELDVDPDSRTRRHTYPGGCRLRFVS